MPLRRVVLYIEITDVKKMNRWWLVAEKDNVDLCLDDPGHEIDVHLITDLLTLTQIYIGDESLEHARAIGKVKLHGPAELIRGMPRWFARSKFADDNPLPTASETGARQVSLDYRRQDALRANQDKTYRVLPRAR